MGFCLFDSYSEAVLANKDLILPSNCENLRTGHLEAYCFILKKKKRIVFYNNNTTIVINY